MRLTLHSDLGFRTLVYLATAGEKGATIPQIASAYAVSEHHLRQVVNELVRLGLVKSTRGRNGGLHLGRAPAEISIGKVMRSLESDFALVDCLGHTPERCVIAGNCGLQHIFGKALRAWFEVLDQHTLADVIRGSSKLPLLLGIAEPAGERGKTRRPNPPANTARIAR
jgi:Rrf2 family nitric oxide-sensitive transcriptional repressor